MSRFSGDVRRMRLVRRAMIIALHVTMVVTVVVSRVLVVVLVLGCRMVVRGRGGEAAGRAFALATLIGLDVEYRELARFTDIRNAVTVQLLATTGGYGRRTRATTFTTAPTATTTATTARLGAGARFLGALVVSRRCGGCRIVLRSFRARLGGRATALRTILRGVAPRPVAAVGVGIARTATLATMVAAPFVARFTARLRARLSATLGAGLAAAVTARTIAAGFRAVTARALATPFATGIRARLATAVGTRLAASIAATFTAWTIPALTVAVTAATLTA